MPTSAKAILLKLSAYLVSNNVPRSVGEFVVNVTNTNGDLTTKNTVVLANNGTYSHSAAVGNKITMVQTSLPLTADITFADSSVKSGTITGLLVTDMEITSIEFTNPDTVKNANLVIISG